MIRQNRKKTGKYGIRLLMALLSLCLVVTMTPFVAFADDGGEPLTVDNWGAEIYVLGRHVTSENCNDILNDGGSVKYDKESGTLTLTNAELDLGNYQSEFIEYNAVSGIDIWQETNIELVGNNEIITDAADLGEGIEFAYGITALDEVTISGSGELSIDFYKTCQAVKYYGIDSTRKLTISGTRVGIGMGGEAEGCGIRTMFRGFDLKDGAVAEVLVTGGTDGKDTAFYDSSYGKMTVDETSNLELQSDTRAIQYSKLSASVEELGAFVNKEMTPEGAIRWDGNTRLSEYKYVNIPFMGGRWGDSVYVLGREVTEENCDDVLGDGTVSFDFGSNTLTLNNAMLDLTGYINSATENNYVAGISTWAEVEINLVGKNLIYSKTPDYADDKEYVYGINAHERLTLSGTGSLDINVNTGKYGLRYYGIDSSRLLTVAPGTEVNVEMDGLGDATGIDANWDGMVLDPGATVTADVNGGTGYAVSDTSFGDSVISDGAVLQMSSDTKAFNYIVLSDSFKNAGAMVNNEPNSVGAQAWDKTTRLTSYKFVKFPENKARSKKANTLAVKGKTATVKYKKLKKKAQTVTASKAYKFTNKGQGKITFAKSGGNNKITVNKTTGKVTVKKGLAKKKYTVKVKVKAAGNANYKAATRTVSVVIIVK